MAEPIISVGVLCARQISFTLMGQFTCSENLQVPDNEQIRANFKHSGVEIGGHIYKSITFTPHTDEALFELHNVVIGIGFHWERNETQRFEGALTITTDKDKLLVINRLPIEKYLFSVIASEMSATSQPELLKAHAVVSRSWLMAQLDKTQRAQYVGLQSFTRTDDETMRWYDREDHTLFDVCADDHCQRYQGLTRANNEAVRQAIQLTRGQLLTYNGAVCDARFSKCCGGATELFETCWQPIGHGYLQSFADTPSHELPDLAIEANAQQWILSAPKSYCNTQNIRVLLQVLNSYDQETADFFRWRIKYKNDELSAIIHAKSGIDFGRIISIDALERGPSGRIIRLRIEGEKALHIVGKELEIRRWLSKSHLYSSAFVARVVDSGDVEIVGAGWGHGVGMCQIGAAMMAHNGLTHKQIVKHYFPAAQLEQWW